MNAALKEPGDRAEPLKQWRAVVAEDLLAIASLHNRELDRELVVSLWQSCYEDFLGLRMQGERAAHALALFREGLTDLPTELCQSTLDRLAADYADIYLTYGLRASPCESVWLDEDSLTLQEPMFRVRQWYKRAGLGVEDWRMRSDDHLVVELHFLAHLLGDESDASLETAARFMDEHLLRWVDLFAERVAARCETRFYAGLALLTAAYLEELRDLLADLLESPRPSREEIDARVRYGRFGSVEVEGPYVPGVAPSW